MTEIEFMKQIGNNIRDALDDWGMSQQELADEAGISQTTISRYINGDIMPSLKNIINIAYVLECDLTKLIPACDRIL